MLPKFRPAAIGAGAAARPSIRPVKPGPPPAPPRPPKRPSSGFGRRDGFASESPPDAEAAPIETSQDADAPTVDGPVDRAVAEVIDAARARQDPSGEAETRALPVDDELVAARQAYALDRAQQRHARPGPPYESASPPVAGDLAVPYDALPSLEVRSSYASYLEPPDDEEEALTRYGGGSREPFETRDALGGRAEARPREGSGARERPHRGELPHPAYAAPVPPFDESGPQHGGEADDLRLRGGAGWEASPEAAAAEAHREAAHAQREAAQALREAAHAQREAAHAQREAAQAQHAAPAEPSFPPPRDDAHRAFPMGVQPLRASASYPPPAAPPAYGYGEPPGARTHLLPHEAVPAMHAVPQTHHLGPVPQPSAHSQHPPAQIPYAHASYAPASMPGAAPPLSVPPHLARPQLPVASPGRPRQPVGPLVQEGSKLGRLPWFVAGVTFGIAFMFFATGVVQRSATPEPAPSVAQATTASAPPIAPPAAASPPAATLPAVTPAALPAAPPAAPGNVYASPVAAPTVYAPAPPPTGFAPGAGGYAAAEPPPRAPAPPSTGAPYAASAPQPRPAPPRPQTRRASAPPVAAAPAEPAPAPAHAPAPANDLTDLMNQALSP